MFLRRSSQDIFPFLQTTCECILVITPPLTLCLFKIHEIHLKAAPRRCFGTGSLCYLAHRVIHCVSCSHGGPSSPLTSPTVGFSRMSVYIIHAQWAPEHPCEHGFIPRVLDKRRTYTAARMTSRNRFRGGPGADMCGRQVLLTGKWLLKPLFYCATHISPFSLASARG